MTYDIFQVDAFTNQAFGGNPAAVVLLEHWITDDRLLAIAAENNLSETAYLVPSEDKASCHYEIRWFTPAIEVPLCGHATLASAHVLFHHKSFAEPSIRFSSKSGVLTVTRVKDRYQMDFPANNYEAVNDKQLIAQVSEAIGKDIEELYRSNKLMAILQNEQQILEILPDLNKISLLPEMGLIITAPGNEVDFVSRFFAPKAGIPEDPVTGSAHCMLTPYWSERLQSNSLRATQVSDRRGQLTCEMNGERVLLQGQAVTYLQGTIELPES